MKYKVDFALTYNVEAKDEEEALEKATEQFTNERIGVVSEFGSNVEEVD